MEPWRDWPVPLVSLTLAMSVPRAVALRRVADEHDAAVGARHRALHQQQVAFVVALDDREVEGGGLLAAGATGHAGAAEDPGRCGAGPDGAGSTVHAVGTVAGPEAAEAVALHDAREPLALADRGDVDQLALRQQVGADLLTDLVLAHVVEPQLDELHPRLDAGLVVLAGDGLGELGGLLGPEGDLERAVPVALVRLDLDHAARAHAQDGDRDDVIVVVPHLRHADLLADDRSCGHGGYVFLWLRTCSVTRTLRSESPRRSVSLGCAARFPTTRACTDISWTDPSGQNRGLREPRGGSAHGRMTIATTCGGVQPRSRMPCVAAARSCVPLLACGRAARASLTALRTFAQSTASLAGHGFRTAEARQQQEPRSVRAPGRRAAGRRVGRALVPRRRRRARAPRRGGHIVQPRRRRPRRALTSNSPDVLIADTRYRPP